MSTPWSPRPTAWLSHKPSVSRGQLWYHFWDLLVHVSNEPTVFSEVIKQDHFMISMSPAMNCWLVLFSLDRVGIPLDQDLELTSSQCPIILRDRPQHVGCGREYTLSPTLGAMVTPSCRIEVPAFSWYHQNFILGLEWKMGGNRFHCYPCCANFILSWV